MNACIITALTTLQLLATNQVKIDPYYQPLATALINRNTQQFVFTENENDPIELASLTKLMTIYTALEHQKDLDVVYEIDEDIVEIAYLPDLSSNKMVLGNRYTIEELITLSLLPSSNAAAHALAKAISGNEKTFVEKMNENARKLNMKHSIFYNSSGVGEYVLPLENTFGIEFKESISTAHDMGILTNELIRKYPFVLQLSNHPSKIVGKYNNEKEEVFATYKSILDDEINGLKTGTGNYNNVIITSDDFISIIIGAGKSYDDKSYRFEIGKQLINIAKLTNKKTIVFEKGIHRILDYEVQLEDDFKVWDNGNPTKLEIHNNILIYNQENTNVIFDTSQQSIAIKILKRFKNASGFPSIIVSILAFVLCLNSRKKTRNR